MSNSGIDVLISAATYDDTINIQFKFPRMKLHFLMKDPEFKVMWESLGTAGEYLDETALHCIAYIIKNSKG